MKVELYEDNAGGLFIVPEGEGIMVQMLQDGDFVTDARLYRDSWVPERDCPDSTHPLNQREIDAMKLIATYYGDDRGLEIEEYLGHAGREYLRVSLEELAERIELGDSRPQEAR